jgi:hypothetical protein
MVVIDATMLMPLLRPDIPIPAAADGTPIEKPRERIDHLVKELERDKTKIIVPAPEDGGRILVRVTETHLYVGNTGASLNKDGIIALLGANSSRKRKNQIGRFGLGFKSLLALGGKIDLFSRSVSIRFDPVACQRTISEKLGLLPEEMPPALRMAEVISFEDEAERDEHLAELGSWVTTVLRAEIKGEGLLAHLRQELKYFPREFVLFLPVKVAMELELGDGTARIIHREPDGDTVVLHEGDEKERWLVVERYVLRLGNFALLVHTPGRLSDLGLVSAAFAGVVVYGFGKA